MSSQLDLGVVDTTSFDPREFDFSAAAADAKAEANIAQLSESLTLIVGGHHELKGLLRRLDTQLADRAHREAERDAALSNRLVAASDLFGAAEVGAQSGAERGVASAAQRLDHAANMVGTVNARLSEDAKRREVERGRWIDAGTYVAIGSVVAILTAGSLGFLFGQKAGAAQGYAEARDQIAAAHWASTANGAFARALDQAGSLTQMRNCSGAHWRLAKVNGKRACFGGSPIGNGAVDGWYLP